MKTRTKILITVTGLTLAGVAAAGAVGPRPSELQTAFGAGFETVDGEKHGWRRHHRHRRGGEGLRRVMKEADANGDNALSQDEVDAFIAEKVKLGDGDGNGEINLSEFETIWIDMVRPKMVRAFQRLDTDGDAVVTNAEIDARFGDIVARMDRNDDGVLSREDRGRRGHGRRFDRERRGN